jgi:hypothetical protein
MTYLPRPDAERTGQDVDEIYALAAEELSRADTDVARRRAFRRALLRTYEAGIDAQRELIQSYPHDRPKPLPPAPEPLRDEGDPGVLPHVPPPAPLPAGTFAKPRKT